MKRLLLAAAVAGILAAPLSAMAQQYQQPPQPQPYQQQPYQQPGPPPQYQPGGPDQPPPGPPPGPPHGFWADKQRRLDGINRAMAQLQQQQACVQNAQDRHQLRDCQPPR